MYILLTCCALFAQACNTDPGFGFPMPLILIGPIVGEGLGTANNVGIAFSFSFFQLSALFCSN